MIQEKDITPVGKFQRTHALKGELNMILDIEPEFFDEYVNPMIVDMDGCYVPFYIESVRTKGTDSFLVKLERVDSEEKAKPFVNKIIYADRAKLKEYLADSGENLVERDEWVGYEVVDTKLGPLGTLEHVDDTTVNILLVIKTPSGEELFIPLHEEFLDAIDTDEKKIIVSVPDGLVDLNKKKDED